jgi:DNA polymerase-3 subunit epsilon
MQPPAGVRDYERASARPRDPAVPLEALRFVALDTETTGLDPRRDRLVSIGAVAVQAGEIRLDDVFEALLQVAYNTSAVTVHGVTRDESRHGLDEPEALERLLVYLADGVVVGHHIRHDVAVLDAACERHFGVRLANAVVDTLDLALHLERAGAFPGREPLADFGLDALCGRFEVAPHDRHTAAGDAFLTARVFQRLYRLCPAYGRETLRRLEEPYPAEAGGAEA